MQDQAIHGDIGVGLGRVIPRIVGNPRGLCSTFALLTAAPY